MTSLTNDEAHAHHMARQLVALRRDLTMEEREFVLTNWHQGANPTGRLDGAFFTPEGLADALEIQVDGESILDLCAGIGRLAYSCRDYWTRRAHGWPQREIVCVERNPDFVAVGRKTMPEATWYCADVMDAAFTSTIGYFDTVVSNPPFGSIQRSANGGGYRGRRFEYHVIAAAAGLAREGAFIIPQSSAPYQHSGPTGATHDYNAEYLRFSQSTGIELTSSSIETSGFEEDWRGAAPRVEIVLADFRLVGRAQEHAAA